jgi:hypothetical protein
MEMSTEARLTTWAMLGCYDDSCDVGHCSVCGRHVMGSDWMRGQTFICDTCNILSAEEREYVRKARASIFDVLYGNDKEASDELWEEVMHVHANR